MNKNTISAQKLCLVAMAVCINVVGGQIALLLRLPIYLDSIGTILTGALLGPVYGLLPNLLSGLILGFTTDVYSLYFAPVGMITGFAAGLVFLKGRPHGAAVIPAAAAVTIPGTLVSSGINAALFGGITSSGSTILVQLLAKTPLGLTASIFLVQILTDYLDRVISIVLVVCLVRALPDSLKEKWQLQRKTGGR